jgi:hypothetical protein
MVKVKRSTFDGTVKMLRALPINERAEAILGMFSICVSEFATMALEHVEAPKPARKAKVTRKVKRRQ